MSLDNTYKWDFEHILTLITKLNRCVSISQQRLVLLFYVASGFGQSEHQENKATIVSDDYQISFCQKSQSFGIQPQRDLQCLVLFELKIEDFEPEFIGKLNFYLEALDRDVKRPHENPSIVILLCKGKEIEVVEYAMARNISPAIIADYETKLIDKKILANKLHQLGQILDNQTNTTISEIATGYNKGLPKAGLKFLIELLYNVQRSNY
ncbi:hypothetical protein FQR65_LT18908 [Abscondita terminalis]|nr:hypothetical protein FQR65_LT18908 [Abscondita terminalis]